MPAEFRSDYSVAYEFYSSVLAYSQKKFAAGAAPNSWADFWDVKKFPGKRAFRREPDGVLEAALASGPPATIVSGSCIPPTALCR